MAEVDLSDIPDDDYQAFLHIESIFRKEFEYEISESNNSYSYYAVEYLNKTIAAAEALGVTEAIAALPMPLEDIPNQNANEISGVFHAVRRATDKLRVSSAITSSRRTRAFSVGLEPEQKKKIHAYLDKVRKEVDASNATISKKEKIFAMIAALAAEVDQLRTRFDRVADLARALAGLSKEVAEEGAEPWWKWMKGIFGVIDESKSEELQLPKPAEIKKITKQDDTSSDGY